MRGADVAPPHSRFPAPTRSATRGLPTTRYGYEGSLYATVAVPLGRQAGVLSGPAVTPKAQDKTIAQDLSSRKTSPFTLQQISGKFDPANSIHHYRLLGIPTRQCQTESHDLAQM